MNAFVKNRRELVAVNMRVDSRQKNFIDAAASTIGSDRTKFVIDAALKAAEEVLLDKRAYFLEKSSFEKFETALDEKIEENQCLLALLKKVSPWESQKN